MGHIWILALKDLKLMRRDRFGLFWIFAFPLLLALFFGSIFSGQGNRGNRALKLAIVDEDRTTGSKKLIEQLKASDALTVIESTLDQAKDKVRRGDLVALLVIPKGYGSFDSPFNPNRPALKIGLDPSRQAEAGYLQGLLTEATFKGMQDLFTNPKKLSADMKKALKEIEEDEDIPEEQRNSLRDFFQSMDKFFSKADPKMMQEGPQFQPAKIDRISISRDQGARPRSSFEITFPSSTLWGILGCVQAFVISIVSERTGGTLLRLRISPLTWRQVLGGKALACFLTCMMVALAMLLFGRLVFGVRIEARPLHLILAIASIGICFVGMMMFLATLGKTIEGVAGVAWGILMPLAMIGGGMIPLIAMPDWMLTLSHFSPVKWGILSLEGAIWREFALQEMLLPCAILIGVGVVFFSLGVRKLSWSEG